MPGFARAWSISSRIVLKGELAGTTTTRGVAAIWPSGVKSFTTSKGSFMPEAVLVTSAVVEKSIV